MNNKINKIILSTAILTTSLYGYTEISKTNVAEAASCSKVRGTYQSVKVGKTSITSTTAAIGVLTLKLGTGLPGVVSVIAGTFVASKDPFTLRMYSVYCTKNGKSVLEHTWYFYDINNKKKLKGPYYSYINMHVPSGSAK